MAITVVNNTNLPINIRVSNAGFTYHYRNDLPPNKNDGRLDCQEKFDVAWVWWDVTLYYSTDETKIDPSNDNIWPAINVASIVGGTVLTAAGLALIPLTGGASTALTIAGTEIISAAAVAVVSAATIAGGVVFTAGDIAVAIAQQAMYPAQITLLYGYYDYLITVSGGFESTIDETTKVVTVTKFNPITAHWKNETTGADGDSTSHS